MTDQGDPRIWRVVGEPLVRPTTAGPLTGESVAVKDLFAVAGQPIGAGNPAWLDQARPEEAHAAVVERLLAAGASVRGITRTDEFAYSLAGQNTHYGTPPNPRAPYRVPGGSSSGSATAVSLGQASIGLGTDTGGSIRVPASYQGLFGIRTTHDAVPRTGVLPLAPSFDTVGWMTRSAALLREVGDVLLPPSPESAPGGLVAPSDLVQVARPDVAAAVTEWLPDGTATEAWPLDALAEWRTAFQAWQAFEAWQVHGDWLRDRLASLGPGVRERFERARRLDAETVRRARQVLDEARTIITGLVGDRVVVLPAAASVAPLPADAEANRDATMSLTCIAGIAGLPAVVVPTTTTDGLPVGVCLVAAAGRDRDLLALAEALA